MEARDRSILAQVAFKGAIELSVKADLDLGDPEGQAQFETMYSYLHNSLLGAVSATATEPERAAQLIQGHFPGAVEQQQPAPAAPDPYAGTGYVDGGYAVAGPAQTVAVRVKGNQFGPLPDWLLTAARDMGITEVYDNRDRVGGTRRPWFKGTSGPDAPAFWPPRAS